MMSKPTSHSTTASARINGCIPIRAAVSQAQKDSGDENMPAGMFSSPESFWAWETAARIGMQPFILALAVVLWLVGFDIIYALQDYAFDKAHGLRSLVVA